MLSSWATDEWRVSCAFSVAQIEVACNIAAMFEDLVPDHIQALVPYPPGKPISELERELGISNAIKLASNENPLGPSPLAIAAVQKELGELHRYPDGGTFYLRQRLADHVGVSPDQLIIGNGSNEIIEFLVRTFASADHGVVTSETAFVVYKLASKSANVPFCEVPMRELTFDLDAILEQVTPATRLVMLCNPNNPTGTMFGQEELNRFINGVHDDAIVVLDEAYIEFVPEAERVNALALLEERPHTIILRTFSKAYGLAGLRIGYGISSPEMCGYVNRVRQPFNVNSLAQVGALAALDDVDYLNHVVNYTNESKIRLYEGFDALGVPWARSYTNFILFDTGQDCRVVYDKLLHLGVIVRPMGAYGLPTYLRVNIGTEQENERFMTALGQVLND